MLAFPDVVHFFAQQTPPLLSSPFDGLLFRHVPSAEAVQSSHRFACQIAAVNRLPIGARLQKIHSKEGSL